jgi:hypothetical protein
MPDDFGDCSPPPEDPATRFMAVAGRRISAASAVRTYEGSIDGLLTDGESTQLRTTQTTL